MEEKKEDLTVEDYYNQFDDVADPSQEDLDDGVRVEMKDPEGKPITVNIKDDEKGDQVQEEQQAQKEEQQQEQQESKEEQSDFYKKLDEAVANVPKEEDIEIPADPYNLGKETEDTAEIEEKDEGEDDDEYTKHVRAIAKKESQRATKPLNDEIRLLKEENERLKIAAKDVENRKREEALTQLKNDFSQRGIDAEKVIPAIEKFYSNLSPQKRNAINAAYGGADRAKFLYQMMLNETGIAEEQLRAAKESGVQKGVMIERDRRRASLSSMGRTAESKKTDIDDMSDESFNKLFSDVRDGVATFSDWSKYVN